MMKQQVNRPLKMKITVMRTYSSTKDRVRKIPKAEFAPPPSPFLFGNNDYPEKFA